MFISFRFSSRELAIYYVAHSSPVIPRTPTFIYYVAPYVATA